jgi:uncharacterized protein involved in exopolysaccharide biosynthesis/Mrp family chromosome partitioning ATPase
MIDARATAPEGRTGIREFARIFYRQKLVILVPTIAIAGIAWALASTITPRFQATAVLTLDVRKIQVMDREVVSRLAQENSVLRTELDVLRSSSLNEKVVDRLGLSTDTDVLREAGADHSLLNNVASAFQALLARFLPGIARGSPSPTDESVPRLTRSQLTNWLLGNLKVTNDGRSLTIVVSFTSESPERAARIANAIAENYLDDQAQTKVHATIKASEWLGRELINIRQQLEASEAAVDDFRRKSGLLEVKGATIPGNRLGDLNAQLSSARLERTQAEVKLQTAQQSDPETLPDIIASPTIQSLRKELTQINSDIAENRNYSTSYKLKVLEDRATVVRKAMSQEKNRILASLTNELEVARKKEMQLAASFQAMESQLGDAAHSNVRLMQLQREADANRSIYETFLARYKQAIEQESLAEPDARIISRAEGGSPTSPTKLRFLLIGVVGGVSIGGALGFLREAFDRRIRHVSDIEGVTGIPVFGFLPKVSRWRRIQPQDHPVTDPHSRFCTALVRIRTALQAPQRLDRQQVLLVTSAQPGDGKTSFCTGLARSLAKSRMRVLVIDADPYRSRVATAFGASTNLALDPILEKRSPLHDIVQRDAKSAAHFIPALNMDDFQLLVHSGSFMKLLEEARKVYDVIIIDTPPVITSADAAVIGRYADIRLLLVRWGRTSWDEMNGAVGFLRLCRVEPDGIVIVGVDASAAGYTPLASYATASNDDRLKRSQSDPTVA